MATTMIPVSWLLSLLRRLLSNQAFTALRRDSDNASSGLITSSRMTTSAPRPVSTPPTEVAKR